MSVDPVYELPHVPGINSVAGVIVGYEPRDDDRCMVFRLDVIVGRISPVIIHEWLLIELKLSFAP